MRETQMKPVHVSPESAEGTSPQASRERNFIVSMTVVIVFVGLILEALRSNAGSLNWGDFELLLLTVLLGLCIAPGFVAALRQRFSLFEPVYIISAAFLLTYVLGIILMVESGRIVRNGIELRGAVAATIVAAIVGLLGFYLGYAFIRFSRPKNRGWSIENTSDRTGSTTRIDPTYTFVAALGGFLITLVLLQLWASLAGIPLSALNAFAADGYGYNVQAQVTGSSSLYLFMFIYSWSALLGLAYCVAPNKGWKLFVLVLYVGVGIVYLLTGGRGSVISHFGTLVLLLYLHSGKEPSFRTIAVVLTVVVLLTGALVALRIPYAGFRQNSDVSDLDSIFLETRKELTERGTAIGTMQVVQLFPESIDYVGWQTLETVAVNIVPRVLWPDKPTNPRPVQNAVQPFSRDLHQLPAYDWVAYYYAGFGIPGSFLGMFGLGLFSGWIYMRWKRDSRNPMKQVVLAVWLPTLFIVFHRGDLVFLLIEISFSILPAIAIWVFTTRIVLSSRSRYRPISEL